MLSFDIRFKNVKIPWFILISYLYYIIELNINLISNILAFFSIIRNCNKHIKEIMYAGYLETEKESNLRKQIFR